MPALSTRDYEVGVRANDALVVNDASPGDVRQATLDEEVDRRAAVADTTNTPADPTMSDDARRRMEKA
jgi:hypothetical protein